jgi:hypothetical protein
VLNNITGGIVFDFGEWCTLYFKFVMVPLHIVILRSMFLLKTVPLAMLLTGYPHRAVGPLLSLPPQDCWTSQCRWTLLRLLDLLQAVGPSRAVGPLVDVCWPLDPLEAWAVGPVRRR